MAWVRTQNKLAIVNVASIEVKINDESNFCKPRYALWSDYGVIGVFSSMERATRELDYFSRWLDSQCSREPKWNPGAVYGIPEDDK